jgi:FkbM family methyltransferase
MTFELLRNNLPSEKPEFWRNAPQALRRRLIAWLSDVADPTWKTRPCLVTIEPGGLLLEVLPLETMSRSVVYYGVYEFAPTALVRSYLEPGDTFVDVGANIGYYSVLAASLVGERGRVVAFEPSVRVRQRLSRSASLNGFTQIEVRAEAVGDIEGSVTLVEPESDNHGLAFVDTTGGRDGVSVRCVRLDAAVASDQNVALVKVDVEGGEAAVFAGAEGLLASPNAPAILFETFRLAEERARLEAHGYEVYSPSLDRGRFCLRRWSAVAEGYRRWEAPNYFAVKSARGRAFAARHLIA